MIQPEFERFLQFATLRIVVSYEEGNGPVQGSGTLYSKDGHPIMAVSAKHCFRGKSSEKGISEIIQIEIHRSFLHQSACLTNGEFEIIEAADEDLAILLITNEEKASIFRKTDIVWEIGDAELQENMKFLGYGYQDAVIAHGAQKHLWNFSQPQDQQPNRLIFQSSTSLSPHEGSSAQSFMAGYSGTGLFLEGSNILGAVVFSLLHKTGLHNKIVAVSAKAINELLLVSGKEPIQANPFFAAGKDYPYPANYVPRSVQFGENTAPINYSFLNPQRIFTLTKLLESNNKLILIGDGGYGKSTELEFLAASYSASGSLYPVLLKLRNQSSISLQQRLETELQDWRRLADRSQLLLLVDGYEESGENKDRIREELLAFAKAYTCKVIISCREAYFVPSQWEDFEPCYLERLNQSEIEEYVIRHLGDQTQAFLVYVEEFQIFDIITIPFYLNAIISTYKESANGNLPKTKAEILKRLIHNKVEVDSTKYNSGSIDRQKILNRLKILEKIALRMLVYGVSEVRLKEVQEIVGEDHLEDFKELPIGRITNDSFAFDHDIFRDYFGAMALSELGLNDIIQHLTFSNGCPQIVPHFNGALSFLLSQLQGDQSNFGAIVNHILEHDPKFILNVPREELDAKVRYRFFQKINEDYWANGISFFDRLQLDRIGDWAALADTNRYLMGLIREAEVRIDHFYAWFFFHKIPKDHFHNTQELIPFLREYLGRQDTRFHSASTLEKLGLLAKEECVELASEYFCSKEFSDIDFSLRLIYEYGLSDELADLLFQEWEGLSNPDKMQNPNANMFTAGDHFPFGDHWSNSTAHQLRKCLWGFKKEANIRQLLTFCSNSDRYLALVFDQFGFVDESLSNFWRNVAQSYSPENGLFELVFDLYIKSIYQHDLPSRFVPFFEITCTLPRVFDQLFEGNSDEFNLQKSLEPILQESFWLSIIKKFKEGLISDFTLIKLVNSAIEPDRSQFRKIVDTETGIFTREELKKLQAEYELARWQKEQLRLFLNDDDFKQEAARLFEAVEKQPGGRISRISLWEAIPEYKHQARSIFIEAIEFARIEYEKSNLIFDYEAFVNFYNTNRSTVLLDSIRLVHNDNQIVVEDFKHLIQELVKSLLPQLANPSHAVSPVPQLVFEYWDKFKVEVPDSVLLNLTLHYLSGATIEHLRGPWMKIRQKVGIEKFDQRILDNLSLDTVPNAVIQLHLSYCAEMDLKESLLIILSQLKSSNWTNRGEVIRSWAFNSIAKLTKGDDPTLERLFKTETDNAENYGRDQLLRLLTKRGNPIVVPHLQEILRDGNQREKLDAAHDLIQFGDVDAMRYIVDYYFAANSNGREFEFERLAGHSQIWILPYLLELLEKFPGQDQYPEQQFSIPALIVQVCLESEQYDEAMRQLHELASSKPNLSWLINSIMEKAKKLHCMHLYEQRIKGKFPRLK